MCSRVSRIHEEIILLLALTRYGKTLAQTGNFNIPLGQGLVPTCSRRLVALVMFMIRRSEASTLIHAVPRGELQSEGTYLIQLIQMSHQVQELIQSEENTRPPTSLALAFRETKSSSERWVAWALWDSQVQETMPFQVTG
jgi:hypothetical protein